MAGFEDSVGLDIREALADLDQIARYAESSLERAFLNAATNLSESLRAEVTAGLTGVDTRLRSEIEAGVHSADTHVAVTGDAAELTGDVTAAVDAADTAVTVTGDAADVTGSIDGAVEAADTDVLVTADAADVTASINAAVGAADTHVELDVDDSSLGAATTQAGLLGTSLGVGATQAGLLSTGLSGASKALGAFGVGVGLTTLVGYLRSAVNGASDLNEAIGKSGEVFGASQDVILEWSETSSRSVLLARQEAIEFAATFGNLFTAMGLAQDAAADLSIDVVQLGADLASFNNIGVDLALEKLRSGLVGEIEPLRQLGVNFNAAQVEAKAFALGLADANGQLSEGAKVQARWALIAEQTAAANGDVARTFEGLANQQRFAAAEAANARREIGEALLPVVLQLTQAGLPLAEAIMEIASALLSGITPAVSGAVPILDALAVVFGILGDGLRLIEPVIGPVVTGLLAFKAVQGIAALLEATAAGIYRIGVTAPVATGAMLTSARAAEAASVAIRSALGPIGLVITGLAIAGSAFGLFGGKVEKGTSELEAFSKALEEANGQLDETGRKAARAFLEERNQLDDLSRAGVNFRGVVDSLNVVNREQLDLLEEIAYRARDDTPANTTWRRQFIKELRELNSELGKALAQLDREGELNHGLAKSIRDLAAQRVQANTLLKDRNRTGAEDLDLTDKQTDAIEKQKKALEDNAKALAASAERALPTVAQAFQAALADVDAFTSRLPTAASAFDIVVEKATEAGAAVDAGGFADSLSEQLAVLETFGTDVRTIIDAGFFDLGTLIAQKGPEAGGALAAELAGAIRDGNPEVAAALDATVGEFEAATGRIEQTLTPGRFLAQLQEQLRGMITFSQNVTTVLQAGFAEIADAAIKLGPEVGGQLMADLAAGIRAGQPELAAELNTAAGQVRITGETMATVVQTEWGPKIVAAQNTALSQLAPAVAAQLTGLPGITLEKYREMVAVAEAEGAIAVSTAAATGAEMTSAFGAGVAPLPGSADAAMADAAAAARAGEPALEAAGLSGGQALVDAAAGAMDTLPGRASSAGEAGGEGLATGMEAKKGRVESVSRALADAAGAAMRAALQVWSPSRVTRSIGQDVAEGLALGMTDGTPVVDASATRLSAVVEARAADLAASAQRIIENAALGINVGNLPVPDGYVSAPVGVRSSALWTQEMVDAYEAARPLAEKIALASDELERAQNRLQAANLDAWMAGINGASDDVIRTALQAAEVAQRAVDDAQRRVDALEAGEDPRPAALPASDAAAGLAMDQAVFHRDALAALREQVAVQRSVADLLAPLEFPVAVWVTKMPQQSPTIGTLEINVPITLPPGVDPRAAERAARSGVEAALDATLPDGQSLKKLITATVGAL